MACVSPFAAEYNITITDLLEWQAKSEFSLETLSIKCKMTREAREYIRRYDHL